MFSFLNNSACYRTQQIKKTATIVLMLVAPSIFAQTKDNLDDEFIDRYIKAQGYKGIITFDASNIKQFWIENSVFSKNGSINIVGQNDGKSIPLKIQLANVDITQDCKIDVITNNPGASFSVINSKLNTISSSSAEDGFIKYHIVSSKIHLEDTRDLAFYLQFEPIYSETLSIKKIYLSFANNNKTNFLGSPGVLKVSEKDITIPATFYPDLQGVSITGNKSQLFLKNNILVSDNTLKTSVKIKNIGTQPTKIYIGYAVYTFDDVLLSGKNYPYNDQILKVESSENGSNKIIVDSFAEWTKNSSLALNVKDDLSDIPNTTFANGKITDIKKLPNGQAEITMDQPLKKALKKGDKVRVHGASGSYLYTNTKKLQPGEEEIFTSSIQKDDKNLSYSSEAFSKGVYYVKPIILSYTIDSAEDNTILITDYTINY